MNPKKKKKKKIFPKNFQNVLMGVAINDKHRVHARKKESFSRVLRKKKRFGDRMVGNVLGSFPARCMIKERQRMLRNSGIVFFSRQKLMTKQCRWWSCRYQGKINESVRQWGKKQTNVSLYIYIWEVWTSKLIEISISKRNV